MDRLPESVVYGRDPGDEHEEKYGKCRFCGKPRISGTLEPIEPQESWLADWKGEEKAVFCPSMCEVDTTFYRRSDVYQPVRPLSKSTVFAAKHTRQRDDESAEQYRERIGVQ